MLNYVIYARESSADTNKAPDIRSQISYIRDFIKQKTKDPSHDFYNQEFMENNLYQDNGFSGGDWTRPAWNELVKDCKRRLFKYVFVWSQDRIARDIEQFRWFCRNMAQNNIVVYTINDGVIDLETAGGKMKHNTLASMDEYFRAITSDKVKRAYSIKKKKCEDKGTIIKWGKESYKYKNEDIINNIKLLVEQNKGQGVINLSKLLPDQEVIIIDPETGDKHIKHYKLSSTTIWRICKQNNIKLDTLYNPKCISK